ncbi:L,D-transpeptidase, partial [Novacetimonas cocois]|uniref:L,D-transpeptidase n=1 Tax=Novacetimonas cocois TaxID=1747507 RepID=UPI001EEFB275
MSLNDFFKMERNNAGSSGHHVKSHMRMVSCAAGIFLILGCAMEQGRAQPATPDVSHEISALQTAMKAELGTQIVRTSPAITSHSLSLAKQLLDNAHLWPDSPQVILVVDRSERVQRLWVTVGGGDLDALTSLGSVRVSTGRPGRAEHFRTPVGIFTNDGQIYGYRAQGTKNEFGVRGNGDKGMRVWDFGWQTTEDWRKKGAVAVVRLEMHATDPDLLEQRLGRSDSEGCIRIPSRFNTFLDRHGLIDRDLDNLIRDGHEARALQALLGAGHVSASLAGDKVVVVDSSQVDAPVSDPQLARKIQDDFAKFLAQSA